MVATTPGTQANGQRDYLPRVVDRELDELLAALPAVVLEGARGVGKTTSAERRAATVHRLDIPAQMVVAQADPERIVAGATPVLIDEWQRLPESWDLVRRAVDADRTPGRFLLTGSATPGNAPIHSGAGRIVTLRLRPMTLAERGVGTPTVSLADLLRSGRPPVSGKTDVGLEIYVDEILASGLPGLRGLRGRPLRAALDGYIDRIVEHDFPQMGHGVRNPTALRAWMTAYSAMLSSTAAYETIRAAATGGYGEKPSRGATQPYNDILQRLWILEPVPAWMPGKGFVSRLGQAPKHQVADPALAARLLKLDADGLLERKLPSASASGHSAMLGPLFESLVTLSVRVFAQAAECSVMHLRTRAPNEREIDLIVQRPDGKVLAIEIKLARAIGEDDVRHLLWLRDHIGADLLDMIVVTTGPEAYRRKDDVAVVPLALLGA
jgi:predicted AAA+ superfamily ATPase